MPAAGWSAQATLVPMNRALIVVDVQESFRARPEWSRMAAPDIARSVGRLVALARDRGDLVVRVLHTEPGTGNVFDPERGHVRPLAELAPALPGEPVLTKTRTTASPPPPSSAC